MDKQSTILNQLELVWREHPDWTFGKLISIILCLEHLDPRLMYLSDEELFKRSVHLKKESNLILIKKLPAKSSYKASELVAHIKDFTMHLEELKLEANKTDRYELILAYALLIDEMEWVREHLESKL